MATIYRCDRCRAEVKTREDQMHRIELPAVPNNNRYHTERELDICNRCLQDIHKAADALPEVARG